MFALAACILASTVISLLFRAFPGYGVRNLPAIVVNYGVCVLCGAAFEGAWPLTAELLDSRWLPLAFVLGFLFIGGFNLNALCVQRAGVAVTSVVQRISLLLSVGFAVLYYGEAVGLWQAVGIALGLLAVVLTVRFGGGSDSAEGGQGGGAAAYLLPIGVFLLAGGIESLLTVAQRSYDAGGDVSFTVGLFAWAGVLGFLAHAFATLRRPPGQRGVLFSRRDLLGGIALGIPNFFSIHLILVALREGLAATTVFPVLNVATIVLSALAALALFAERLSPKQWAGVATAVVAIALLTMRST